MRIDERDVACQRRQFLKVSAFGAAAGITCSALSVSANQTDATQEEEKQTTARHRLQKLSLLTTKPLPEMAAFYKDVLEMDVQLNEKALVVEGGGTQITFSPAPGQTKPYYHFAFNIPENKILSARGWLGERTKLAVTPEQQRAKGFPNEVRPLDFWNSHSIFFWDPAGNILELICRHDMQNSSAGEFRSDEILYASEIGLVAEGSVNELAGEIKSTFQLQQYRGGDSGFRAIGDETGLLVLFRQGGTPIGAMEGQSWQVFPTDVTVRTDIALESSKLPHSIRTS